MRFTVLVGRWFVAKYRRIAEESGREHALKRMKKEGIPIEIAWLILFGVK